MIKPEPGRALDSVIAEKVMGWRSVGYDEIGRILGTSPENASGIMWEVPHYSTNIADAWTIIEKLTKETWVAIEVVCRPQKADAGYAWENGNQYMIDVVHGGQGAYPGPRIFSNSAPFGICLVSLQLGNYKGEK